MPYGIRQPKLSDGGGHRKKIMKITQTTYWTEQLELTRPYTIAYERIDSVENIFVCLQAEDGSIGVGVAAPDAEVTGESVQDCSRALETRLESLLMGADVRHLRKVLRDHDNDLLRRMRTFEFTGKRSFAT